MLPSQASTPVRRFLRPCIRLYHKHCSSLSIAGTGTASSSPILTSSVSNPTILQTFPHSFSLSERFPHSGPHCAKAISTSCTFCDIVREQAEEISDKKSLKFENGEKLQVILTASFDNLMNLAPQVESGYQACLILQKLSALHLEGKTQPADAETLLQDRRLSKVTEMVDAQILRLSPKVVLATLKALYQMTATDVYVVKSFITQMLWLLRRLPIPTLIQVVELHQNHQETSLRESVVRQSLMAVERRWVELTNPKDLVFLMYATLDGGPGSQTLVERLEDRALDLVEKASPKELYRILYLLSRQRHRNTPLIRAVVYHLQKPSSSFSSLSAIHMSNLVYALCCLCVYDAPLLTKISSEILTKQDGLTPELATSLMESFSRLRWKESSVIQLLLKIISGAAGQSGKGEVVGTDSGGISSSPWESLEATEKVRLILSLANLNLVDVPQCKGLVEMAVCSPAVQDLKQSNPLMWLELVWSLAMLRMLDAASASSVLTDDFWNRLPGSDSFQSVVNLVKVNNINMAARFEVEGYSGPFLPATITSPDAKLLQKGERKVTEKLMSALTNFAPLDSYTLANTTAPGGYLIDAEFYVDDTGNPKPLSQVSQNSSDCHRIALKVLDFSDLALPTSDLTGLHAMASRHLHCQGYTVMEICHTEVSDKTKVVELVQFLQQKIKDTLKVNKTTQAGS